MSAPPTPRARGALLMLSMGALAGLVLASPRVHLAAAEAGLVRLQAIGVRTNGTARIVQIETSEPVAYTTSQPDAGTLLVDLRNVRNAITRGVAPLAPISDIRVESARAPDGTAVARVRLALAGGGTPRVRSSRNLIFVEVDQVRAPAPSAQPAPRPAAPRPAATLATLLRSVLAVSNADGTTVTLTGNGRLVASNIEEPTNDPPRLVLDFPGVSPDLPAVTQVGKGPVDRVRLSVHTPQPLVTRVVIELSRRATFRVDPAGADGEQLVVRFADQAPAAPPSGAPVTTPAAIPGSMTPPAAAPASAASQPATAGRYTGHPVSLDFQGADLRAVLRTFSEISGLNVVIDPTIQGTVDVALRDVPWDQALDIILRANKLGYLLDGTIVRIAPLTVLAEEEAQRRKLAEEQALSGQLDVMTRSLSYAKAQDIAPLLTRTVMTARGTIETDPRTNTIIITDLPGKLGEAAELIATLDRPQPQVEIEARIVQTSRTFARALGIQWGFTGRASQALGNALPLAFPNQGSITGRTGATQGEPAPAPQTDATSTVVDLGVQAARSAVGLSLGSVNGAINLDVALSALESSGNGRLLSTPRVSTQNNVEAEITQGVQIPIQTVANNTVTVTFKDAALTLKVTPQITASNTVIMRISVENASPDFSRSVNNIPPIDTQRAITQVLVYDGETTVIGGIYVSREQSTNDRTPGLHRIPLLGWLFKRDTVTDESRELLIFITPRIIRS